MAVQWGLANPGQGYDYLETLQQLGQAQARQQSIQNDAYKLQTMQRQDAMRPQIAQQVQAGDYSGAAGAAAAGGDFDYASAISKIGADKYKQLGEQADVMGSIALQLRGLPPEARRNALIASVPALRARGFSPDELRNADLSDGSLDGYIATAQTVKDVLGQQMDAARFGETQRHNQAMESKPRWQFDSESGSWLQEPGTGAGYAGPSTVPQQGGGGQASVGAAPGLTPDAAFERLIQVESGGRPGAVGPQTQYGQAIGMTQMLPATAQEMARKLGLPWRPDLLSGKSQEAAQYQRQLGRAYFDEGLQRYGGDIGMAARYYHGGPNQKLWGPKTEEYARKVAGAGAPPAQPQSQPGVVNVRPAKRKDAPSGYTYSADGTRLEAIPGGPADKSTATARNVQSDRKAETDFRKEFDSKKEVSGFKVARSSFNSLKSLAMKENPTPQDDIAIVFNYMKTLDPTSVVREGEFATAQNAAGVDESIRNLYNRARSGNRLNRQQRLQMAETALANYKAMREAYNATAEQFRGYAKDYGLNPDRVARRYVQDGDAKGGETRVINGFKVTRVQ